MTRDRTTSTARPAGLDVDAGDTSFLSRTAREPAERRNSSSSLRRAISLLMHVAARSGPSGVSLTDLATELHISKSSASRLAVPLVDCGLLERTTDRGGYRLGSATLELGQEYLHSLDLRTVAVPHLRELLVLTEDTCHLVVQDGLHVVYIDKVENVTTVRMASRIGKRMPLQCTAVGKAILAFSGPHLLEQAVLGGLLALTPWSITEPDDFRREIARTGRRGYAVDDRENEPEVRCVAAPIFDHENVVVGALSVSALAGRMTVPRVRELGPHVAVVGLQISADMGSARARRALAARDLHQHDDEHKENHRT